MRWASKVVVALAVLVCSVLPAAAGQSETGQQSATSEKVIVKGKKSKGPGGEMASGGGDVGKGTAKGAADLGKGTAGGAVDLATGHPIDAAASVGKGAAGAGAHVGVGAVKGGAKIGHAAGRGIGGLFHHRHHKAETSGQ